MGINLRSTHIGMPKQGLCRANVTAAVHQFRGKSLSEGVTARWLANRRRSHNPSRRLLYRTDVQVVLHDVAFIVSTRPPIGRLPLLLQRVTDAFGGSAGNSVSGPDRSSWYDCCSDSPLLRCEAFRL